MEAEFLGALLRFDHELAALLAEAAARHGDAIYLLLFALVFCEIGVAPLFFLPGDPLLFLCGALSVAGGLDAAILVPLFFAAALLGSLLAYAVGGWFGRQASERRWLNRAALERAHGFFAGSGGWGLLVSPYVAVLRTFAPHAAGAARMGLGRFTLAAGGGALLWSAGLVGAGHFLGNVPFVRAHMGALIIGGIGLGLGGLALRRWRR